MSIAVAPGEVLAEKLAEMGMSQAEFSRRTDFTTKHVNQIVKGHTGYSADAAIRFERVTGISARLWLGLQAEYELALARGRYVPLTITTDAEGFITDIVEGDHA